MPLPPDDFNPKTGIAMELEPGIRRILAPNPSPMTYRGTNTYLIGTRELAVIDPGPDDPDHLNAILGALGPGETITHIVVTHSHLDHSPLARPLANRTGAPILAFGGPTDGRSAVMTQLALSGLAAVVKASTQDFRRMFGLPMGKVFKVTAGRWMSSIRRAIWAITSPWLWAISALLPTMSWVGPRHWYRRPMVT